MGFVAKTNLQCDPVKSINVNGNLPFKMQHKSDTRKQTAYTQQQL